VKGRTAGVLDFLGWREGRTAMATEIRRQRAAATTGELPLEDRPSGDGEEVRRQRGSVLSRKKNEVYFFKKKKPRMTSKCHIDSTSVCKSPFIKVCKYM